MLLLLGASSPASALAQGAPDSTRAGAPDSVAAEPSAAATPTPPTSRITAQNLVDLGFENVTVEAGGAEPRVAYENRRYRHVAESLGRIEHAAGGPVLAFERRLGLVSAAIRNTGTAAEPRFSVRYPSDSDFPAAPAAPVLARTSHSVDLVVGPLFGYELGRLTDPIQIKLEIEPRIRYNPWPGARATASVVIPVYSDFAPSVLHPDDDRFRPGLGMLEQFAWVPGVALTSAAAGLFGDNRYGVSVGAARPLFGGRFLVDGQLDYTGFVSFEEQGLVYSSVSQVSSFLGASWRIPRYDATVTVRGGQYLYGDLGTELQFKRSFGDVDLSLTGVHTEHLNLQIVRVTVPVPPMTRSTAHPIRIQPIERFPISYRTDATPVGVTLSGIASREDFLRQLNNPALDSNDYRYRLAQGLGGRDEEPGPVEWVNFSGASGFINTPWAATLSDRSLEIGYNHIPAKWSYSGRPRYVNQPYFSTVGLLPRLEVSMRFTRIPGLKGFIDDPDNLLTTDTDHMASFRLMVLTPTEKRPGLAVGVEDIDGTRRFHSSYAVLGMPFRILHVQNRFTLGYAPRVFTAARHVLDGGFGAFEVSPWRAVAARVEYDTEKWNVGFGVGLGYGVRLRATAFNFEKLGVGAGWYHKL